MPELQFIQLLPSARCPAHQKNEYCSQMRQWEKKKAGQFGDYSHGLPDKAGPGAPLWHTERLCSNDDMANFAYQIPGIFHIEKHLCHWNIPEAVGHPFWRSVSLGLDFKMER